MRQARTSREEILRGRTLEIADGAAQEQDQQCMALPTAANHLAQAVQI